MKFRINSIIGKLVGGFAVASAALVAGAIRVQAIGLESGKSAAGKGNGLSKGDADTTVTNIVNVAMYAIGVISVIIIIYAGIMYATAAGDEAKVKKAKNTIVGGVIGLAISILALVIVNFVIAQVK
ncbi:hypothetical protein FWF93_00095 [Candidatus Saccharibacteria bacterium]|nr:hypothetical protein [Candidatus Saccharibacteria bacterium]